jgi:hypothetical protein
MGYNSRGLIFLLLSVRFFLFSPVARNPKKYTWLLYLYVWLFKVARMGEDRGVHRVLVGKPEEKRPLGRPRRRWEDNIKVDLQKVGGGRGYWMELAQDRDRWRALVGTVRNFGVP